LADIRRGNDEDECNDDPADVDEPEATLQTDEDIDDVMRMDVAAFDEEFFSRSDLVSEDDM